MREAYQNEDSQKTSVNYGYRVLLALSIMLGFAPMMFAKEAPQHTVVFLDWDNTEVSRQLVTHGEAAREPDNPSRTNYAFDGWDKDFSSVEEDMVIRAKYTALQTFTIEIIYRFTDNRSAEQPYIATVKEGYSFNETIASPKVDGYQPDRQSVTLNIQSASENVTEFVTYDVVRETPYTVNHYVETVNGEDYELFESEELFAATEELVEAVAKDYEGFTPPETLPSATIAADGETVLDVRYSRNSYAVYFDVKGGSYVEPLLLLYGAEIDAPEPAKNGYTFEGWEPALPTHMPAEDLYADAAWETSKTARYTVRYWLQNANDSRYSYLGAVAEEGDVGSIPEIADDLKASELPEGINLPSTGRHSEDNYFAFNKERTSAENINAIKNDGSTTANIFFTRIEYTYAFYLNHIRHNETGEEFDPNKDILLGDYYHIEDPQGKKYVSTKKVGDGGIVDSDPDFPEEPNAANGDGLYTFTAKLGEDLTNKWPTVKLSDPNKTTPLGRLSYYAYTEWNKYSMRISRMQNFATHTQIGTSEPGDVVNIALYGTLGNKLSIPFVAKYQDIGGGNNYTDGYPLYWEPDTPTGDTGTLLYKPRSVTGFKAPTPEQIEYNYIKGEEITSVHARYEREQYTITFKNGDQMLDIVNDVWFEENLSRFSDFVPETPTDKSGYEFAGWYTDPELSAGSKVDLENAIMPAGGLVLYASWEAGQYDVNFDPLNGVDEPFTQTVEAKEYATEPGQPSKEGYKFVGWREAGKKVNFMFSNPIYKDTDLVAVWAPITNVAYTVHYLDENGDPLKDAKIVDKIRVGDTVTERAEVVDKYLPDKVSKSIVVAPQDSAITFHYVPFETVDYVVNYVEAATGDTLKEEKTVTTEKSIITEEFERISGYYPHQYQITLQLSQDPDDNKVEFTYIKNSETPYTIRHYKQNISGTGYTPVGPETILSAPAGSTVETPIVDYTGFSYNDVISTASAVVSADESTALNLYYVRNEFEVRFNAGANGSLSGNTRYTGILYETPFKTAASVPTPTASPGYRFTGWTPSLPTDAHAITEDMTFTANFAIDAGQWARVSYNANGGTGSMATSSSRLIGSLYQIAGNGFSRTDHNFVGWRTAPTGGTFYSAASSFRLGGNVTLYAQWEEIIVPVTPITPPVDPPIPPVVDPEPEEEVEETEEPTPDVEPTVTTPDVPVMTAAEEREALIAEIATDNSPVFTIGGNPVPLFGRTGAVWGLFNLVLTIVGALLAVIWAVGLFRTRKIADEDTDEFEEDYQQRTRKTVIWRILGIVTALVSIVAFFITQDMSLSMAIFDKWTILMVSLFVVQLVFGILMRRNKINLEDDDSLDVYHAE